ncbi:MAG: carbon starvation protein A [Butyrivibrio sp.]|nr:carbon starvation protein A [Butyrivibrio sp.]
MISFIVCFAVLVAGYFIYGALVDRVFGPDDRDTPAVRINDGVDFVAMPRWKLFLIQLLNIAGLGPIYGALAGAQWGTSVFLWITLGTIFAGGVHDFAVGFMSMRHDGASVSELTGKYLGNIMKTIMRVFSVVLLVMVGTVFAVGPAGLISLLFGKQGASGLLTNTTFWLVLILIYYFIATFVPIDKIIGKLYPVFGICLIVMAIGVGIGIFTHGYTIPEIQFANLHPSNTPIWPMMFVSVACGAISGFHATQSPLMARCCKSEKESHMVFYGAMVCEGIIALIWAAAGSAVYAKTGGLTTGLTEMLASGQAACVYDICTKTMGGFGIVLAMLGVIACPITSGDTAFRSARLVLADWFNIEQKQYSKRLYLCVPLLLAGAFISQLNYGIVWRYFSWSNQTLAMIALWTASMYLYKNGRVYLLTVIPATFMSAVSVTYFFIAPECLHLSAFIAYPVGIIAAIAFLALFIYTTRKTEPTTEKEDNHGKHLHSA